jgi:hypothetical protein
VQDLDENGDNYELFIKVGPIFHDDEWLDNVNGFLNHKGEHSYLREYGYYEDGLDYLADGSNCIPINHRINKGYVCYQTLKHTVADKIQARETGRRNEQTNQPLQGKKQGGGVRYGEMEGANAIGQGAAGVVLERLYGVADPFDVAVCIDCDEMVWYDQNNGYKCKRCGGINVGKRNYPFSTKLVDTYLGAEKIRVKRIYATLDEQYETMKNPSNFLKDSKYGNTLLKEIEFDSDGEEIDEDDVSDEEDFDDDVELEEDFYGDI